MPRFTLLPIVIAAAFVLPPALDSRAQTPAPAEAIPDAVPAEEEPGRFGPFRNEIQRLRERLNILPQRGQTESVDPDAARQQAETLGADPSANAQVDVAQLGQNDAALRIGALENQIRILTGQIEELQFRVQQLEARLGAGAAAASQSSVQVNLRDQAAQLPQQGTGNLPPPPPGQGGTTLLGAPPQDLGQLSLGTDGQPFNLNAQDFNQNQQDSGLLPAQPQASDVALATAPPSDDPRDHYDLAYGFFLRGEYDTARNAFAAFVGRFPDDALAGNATYWIGETYYQQQNYADAARSFLDTSENHAGSPKAPDAMLRLGQSLGRLNQRDAACSTFSELQRRYPQAEGDVNTQARQSAQGLGC